MRKEALMPRSVSAGTHLLGGELMSTETTKMKGQEKQVKGKVKQAVGRATGNDRMKASGSADVAKGKAQSALGDASTKVKKITKRITGKR